jgi:hypothetical protein
VILDLNDADTRTQDEELNGFDLDLVGFDCNHELWGEWLSERQSDPNAVAPRWKCPFNPGCGATKWQDCPMMKRLATLLRAPRRMQ